MKLTRINITNTLGCRRFDAAIKAPVMLLAGTNAAGKTSIIQAVRYALTGQIPRVSLKKDAQSLVTDGAKNGIIGVEWADGGKATVALPDGKLIEGHTGDIHPALPIVCDMHAAANMPANDLRSLLFRLSGVSASAESVREKLADRGALAAHIEAILPLLRAGFPAAHKEAAGKATEAKGAWRAITGETYGAKKAETWAAEKPAVVSDALPRFREALAQIDDDIEAESKALGASEHAVKEAVRRVERIAELKEKSGRLASLQEKLKTEQADLDNWKSKLDEARRHKAMPDTLVCPDCGAVLVYDVAEKKLLMLEREPGDDTAAELSTDLEAAEQAHGLLTRAVANTQRDIATAQAAATELAELKAAAGAVPSEDDLEASRALISDLKARRVKQKASIDEIEAAQRAADAADEKTSKAAGYHADVVAWSIIADAMAPDGIPGELLSQALKPINDLLAQAAADTGWNPVTIDAEMSVRFGGRLYVLLSESEQWRADAMLTYAIAVISGVKLMLLDRLDVLDIPGRGRALGWLGTIAAEGEIDTCIVAGTLKSLPNPGEDFQCHWIECGEIASLKQAA